MPLYKQFKYTGGSPKTHLLSEHRLVFFFAAFFPEANEEIQHDHGFRDCANASLLSGVVNDGLHAAFDVALRRGG